MDPRPHHEEVGENWQPALLTERVIASRALTFHRVKHRECAHAFFSCNAYLETLRYVRYENVTQSPSRLRLFRIT